MFKSKLVSALLGGYLILNAQSIVAQSRVKFTNWCEQIKSSSEFSGSGLKTLMRHLKVHTCSGVDEQLRQHRHLWLDGAGLRDIDFLRFFSHLEQIDLTDNYLSDISPLSGFTRLTHLWLGENEIVDISPVATLANIKLLVLEDNRIKNPMPISGCKYLQALDLSRNEISSTEFVRPLSDLRYIYLNHNRINSLRHLACLGDLFSESFLEDVRSDAGSRSLLFASVEINWNQFSNRQINGAETFRLMTIHGNPLVREYWESGAIKKTPYNCPVNSIHPKVRLTCLGLDG